MADNCKRHNEPSGSIKCGDFYASWETVSCSRNLLHEVSKYLLIISKFSSLYGDICYSILQMPVRMYSLFAHETTKTDTEHKDPVLTVQLLLRTQDNCPCTGKAILTGSYLIWTLVSAVYRGDCKGIAQSPPPPPHLCHSDKYPVNTSKRSRFV